jgi:hypothetical protein
MRCNLSQSGPHALTRIIRQSHARHLGQRPDHLPVVAGSAHGRRRGLGILYAAFGVDVGSGFFGVGSSREDDVGAGSTTVAMVSLVNDKGVGRDFLLGEIVCSEQVNDLGGGCMVGTQGEGGEEEEEVNFSFSSHDSISYYSVVLNLIFNSNN